MAEIKIFFLLVLLFSSRSYDSHISFSRQIQKQDIYSSYGNCVTYENLYSCNEFITRDMSTYSAGSILALKTLCTCIISAVGQYIYAYYFEKYRILSTSTFNFTTTSSLPTFNSLKSFCRDTKQRLESDTSVERDAVASAKERSADLFFRLICVAEIH